MTSRGRQRDGAGEFRGEPEAFHSRRSLKGVWRERTGGTTGGAGRREGGREGAMDGGKGGREGALGGRQDGEWRGG